MKENKRKSLNKRKQINRTMKRGSVISLNTNSFIYDSYLDILEVEMKGRTDHSINFDDLIIIGLDNKNKISNIEFLNISKIFGVPLKILKNINSGKILLNEELNEKKMFISLNLKSENMSERFVLPPIDTQLNNNSISI